MSKTTEQRLEKLELFVKQYDELNAKRKYITRIMNLEEWKKALYGDYGPLTKFNHFKDRIKKLEIQTKALFPMYHKHFINIDDKITELEQRIKEVDEQ